jgi:2-polyprenyl-3-methyl-5-hydroxy-6-metoxy-1,4-benzoquinol methylase
MLAIGCNEKGMIYKFHPDPYGAQVKLLNLIGRDRKVLDVGCATGYMAQQLRTNGCSVVGIEVNPQAAELAKQYCEDVLVGDLDCICEIPYEEAYFDAILLSDVLEHVRNPLRVLQVLQVYLKDDGMMYVGIPNVANWKVRLKLLMGRFEYEELGILDRTHLRFFTLKTARELMDNTRLEIVKFDVSCGVPLAPRTGRIGYVISRLLPTLFALQFLIVARKK